MPDELRTDTGPFAMVPAWVLEHPELGDRAVRVYAALARFADNDTGSSWPSRATLAERCGGCSVDSVDRALRQLRDLGAITVERRRTAEGDPDTSLYTIRRLPPDGLGVAAPVRPPGRDPAAGGGREAAALTRPTGTRPRARDEVWDALVAVWGEPTTDAAKRARGKVVRDLRRNGLIDGGELERRGRLARQRWTEATPNVLLTRWDDLEPPRSVHDSVADLEQRRRAQ